MASFWIKVACLHAPPFIFPNVSQEIPIMSFTAEPKAAIENDQEVGMRRALAQLHKWTDDQTAHERKRGGKVQSSVPTNTPFVIMLLYIIISGRIIV